MQRNIKDIFMNKSTNLEIGALMDSIKTGKTVSRNTIFKKTNKIHQKYKLCQPTV